MRAVAAVFCWALLISAWCWAGLSLVSRAPVRSGLGWGAAGLAAAGVAWMPMARNAAVETRAAPTVARW